MRMRAIGAAAVLTLLLGGSVAGEGNAVSLKGEVVDMHCYLTRGAKGSEHAGCGNACLARGVTAGFLSEDGKLYLLLGEKPFAVKEAVAGLAGETVALKGTLVERAGVAGIQLQSVEKLAAR